MPYDIDGKAALSNQSNPGKNYCESMVSQAYNLRKFDSQEGQICTGIFKDWKTLEDSRSTHVETSFKL